MVIIKLGEAVQVTSADIQPIENILADADILARFKKFAGELKTIAPAAKDFLYFTAVMMHAAEASLLDDDGEIKKDASGNEITANWDVDEHSGSWRWKCSDQNIKPYKNSNSDIFPELELKRAYKKWIGKPLCLDHKSSSVDYIRGVIVDTYYDPKKRRVIALCALDKLNYPDLAHKVASGVAACVSMGTAVGRAICYDCGKVARVESDFCNHMRNKSCYGEINTDLAPIELSIVVNGADPKAKIKHVIAKDLSKAAEHIDEYIQTKLSQDSNMTEDELASVRKDLRQLSERVNKLVEAAEEDKNDLNYGTTDSNKEMTESETDPASVQLQPSFASNLLTKISNIEENVQRLIKNEEPTMTDKQAYYLGTEEPTPGKPRYEKEPMNDQVRESQDKQMVGQPPFPGVGPVDGMHPGHASFGESEEARKRRLQRMAEVEDRQMRRLAALEKAKEQITKGKEAYWQGGGDVNEPTPGKRKYPADPRNDQARKEDKHMVGQPPFPGVGSVDGLHPSPSSADQKNELARKEMLSRASLKAKFVKASSPNGTADPANSCWQVFAGNNLILSATVDEITRGNTEVLYDTVATKDFGLAMLNKIKTEGFEKAKALYKQAQPAPALETPGSPADAAPAPAPLPAGPMEPLDEPLGAGAEGENNAALAKEVRELADETAKRADDLVDAVDKMSGEAEQLADVAPASESDFADDGENKTASVQQLQKMRKTVNGMLIVAMQDSIKQLRAHAEELSMAADIFDNEEKVNTFSEAQNKSLNGLASDAVDDAKSALAESVKLLSAFVKYAHGTDSLLKRAAQEAEMQKTAQDGGTLEDFLKGGPPKYEFEGMEVKPGQKLPPVDTGAGKAKPMPVQPRPGGSGDPLEQSPKMPKAPGLADDTAYAADEEETAADENEAKVDVPEGTDLTQLPPGSKTVEANLDLTTKEGRAAYRMKLAQQGVQFSDMLNKAHPKGGATPSGFETKPSGNLGHVEDLEEAHDEHMRVVNVQPKVRKQAEKIAQLVSEGQISKDDVDMLVSNGVDSEAVKYYKQYLSEAKDSESKQWASDLVKEHAKQKLAEETERQHVRIKRAYELAYQMRDAGVIETANVENQVKDILKWNDDAFESTKRMVAKQAMRKNAMPEVGLMHESLLLPPALAEQSETQASLVELFDSYWAGKRL